MKLDLVQAEWIAGGRETRVSAMTISVMKHESSFEYTVCPDPLFDLLQTGEDIHGFKSY
jgi:hypothetical protein